MSEDFIVAKKIIKDDMISNKLTPESVQITNKLLCSVNTARQKYGDQLAENKKTKNAYYWMKQQKLWQNLMDYRRHANH